MSSHRTSSRTALPDDLGMSQSKSRGTKLESEEDGMAVTLPSQEQAGIFDRTSGPIQAPSGT